MSAELLPTCRYCYRKFVPDARNRDRQRVCRRPECRKADSRAKKRLYYHRRLEREEGFLEAERVRCREAMRASRRRAAERSAPKPGPACAHGDLLAGLVSQLGGTADPAEVAAMMGVYADRGRRLAASAPFRGPPP